MEEVLPEIQKLLGMVFWVEIGPPRALPSGVPAEYVSSERSVSEDAKLAQRFYWTHLRITHPDQEESAVLLPWPFVELIGRGPEDFRESVELEEYSDYVKAYLREKEEARASAGGNRGTGVVRR